MGRARYNNLFFILEGITLHGHHHWIPKNFMKEKVLNQRRNGLAMLGLIILLYVVGIGILILGANLSDDGAMGAFSVVLVVVGAIWITVGWVPLMGLKILKPQ